jgi:hypothetical protein
MRARKEEQTAVAMQQVRHEKAAGSMDRLCRKKDLRVITNYIIQYGKEYRECDTFLNYLTFSCQFNSARTFFGFSPLATSSESDVKSSEACSDIGGIIRDEPPKCRTFLEKKHLPKKKASAQHPVSFEAFQSLCFGLFCSSSTHHCVSQLALCDSLYRIVQRKR